MGRCIAGGYGMTKEDIIRMAREAGAMFDHMTWVERDLAPVFERFSALVVAAEREKLATWMMRQGYATGHGDTVEDLLKELEWQIDERIRNEREACAKVCDVLAVHPEYASDITKVAAQAIRARR
jgi:uncharacterized protein Usg